MTNTLRGMPGGTRRNRPTVGLVVLVASALAAGLAPTRLRAGENGQACASRPAGTTSSPAIASQPADPCSGEWVLIPAGKSTLEPMTTSQIIATVRKYAAGITSRDVWYRLVDEQLPSTYPGPNGRITEVPAMRWEARVHEIAGQGGESLEQWFREPSAPDTLHHTRDTTDGQRLYHLDEERHTGLVSLYKPGGLYNGLSCSYRTFLATAIPSRTAGHDDWSGDLLAVLDDPDLKVLDERTEVNGHECYVIESRTVTHPRVFATVDEAMAWREKHPDEKGPMIVSAAPKAAARKVLHLVRLAVDPRADFMPVRLWTAVKISEPAHLETPLMPGRDVRITRTARTAEGIAVPMAAELVRYDAQQGEPAVSRRTRLEVEKVSLNTRIDPATFRIDFPQGTGVLDQIRDISYTVGDSPETLKTLEGAAARRKTFYDGLLGKAPPELHAAQWLVGRPMRLADLKGRQVIVHFWNIGCGPCVAQLPRLQEQYGNTLAGTGGPVFISVHCSCDGKDLAQVQAFLKGRGVTFPVMLDTPDPDKSSWGLTHRAYGITQVPQDAVIDKTGRLMSVGQHRLEPGE